MRLVLFDLAGEGRRSFYPLALSRPLWDLRCGMTSLGEKLIAKLKAKQVACFVPLYMAAAYRARTTSPVNDASALAGDDLLLVSGRVKAATFDLPLVGPSEVGVSEEGQVLYARVARADAARLPADSVEAFLAAAGEKLPKTPCRFPTWNYIWELVLANPAAIVEDFAARGRSVPRL